MTNRSNETPTASTSRAPVPAASAGAAAAAAPDPRVPRSLDQLPPGLGIPDSAVCVFASGSLVAGWGHLSSDIDLYVVTAQPAPVTPAAELPLGLSAQPVPVLTATGPQGVRYDVEYWTIRQVDDLFEAVTAARPGLADRLGYTARDWFFRLSIGVALLGDDWLQAARQRLAASPLNRLLAAHEFHQADSYIDDALGLLGAGDHESAVLAARLAFGHTVDGALYARGSLAPNVKWRYRKFAELADPPLPPGKYWRLETARDLDLANPRPWVEQVVQTCQSLMLEVDFS